MTKAEGQRSRWWRWAGWSVLAILVVAGLVLLGIEVAVRQPGVQGAIKRYLEREIEARTGLVLQIDSLRLSLVHSYARVEGLTLAEPDAAPLVQLESLEVEWRLSSLWRRPLTLRRLEVSGPQVDVGAPRPTATSDSADQPGGFSVVVEEFRLLDGRIEGPVMPDELHEWIEDWWLQDLRVNGHYGPETMKVDMQSAARWLRTDGEEVELSVVGSLTGPQSGPWEMPQLHLAGDGVEAQVSMTIGQSAADPFEGRFRATIEPHRLVPVSASTLPIRADGDFNIRHQTARLRLEAPSLRLDLASPWVAGQIPEPGVLADWQLSLGLDVTIDGLKHGPVGMAEVRLARDEQIWVTGQIELPADESIDRAAAIVDLEVLPALAGQRSIYAAIEAPGWDQLGQMQIGESAVEVVGTDLNKVREALAGVWTVTPLDSADPRSLGMLDARGSVTGPMADLRTELNATWRDGDSTWLKLEGSASASQVQIESFEGTVAGRAFRGRGSSSLPTPISSAELQIEVDNPLPEVPFAALTANLETGVLTAVLEPRTSNGVTSRIEAALPLATLASIEELAETIEGLPVVKASGPLRVEWSIPEGSWGDLFPTLSDSADALTSARFGSSGALELDPSRPLAGEGRIVVDGLYVTTTNVQFGAEGPITLRLDAGELILEPARFGTADGLVEVEIWSSLWTDWAIGSPPMDALEQIRVEANGNVPVALLSGLMDDVLTDGDLQVGISVAGTPESLTGEVRVLGRQASLRFGGAEGIEIADPRFELVLENEGLRIEQGSMSVEGAPVALAGRVPQSTLRAWMGEGALAEARSLEPLHLEVEVGETDWADTLDRLGVENGPESITIGGRAEIETDPRRPLEASGWVEIEPLALSAGDHDVAALGPIRLDLEQGELRLTDLAMRVDGQPFTLAGSAILDTTWDSEEPVTALVRSLGLQGQGTLAAALLNPFLAGGSAEGLLQVDLDLQGTLEEPRGRLRVAGPDASVLFVSPYVARIEAPELEIELVDGRAHIRDGRIRLNDGDVELGGSIGLDGAELAADFDGLRFRLDYGLFVKVDGDLDLELDPQGRGRLTGDIIVDQGSLTRQISIDRDFITNLLSPIDLTGAEESLFDNIALDLRLETRRGVRVRNNVADLAVGWSGVRVRGTLLEPVIDGQFFVEPGGRAFLFGQTLRVDRGVITFPGQPGAEAVLDLETTSSLDDPSISRLAGDDALSLGQLDSEKSLQTRAEDAAATFVSEQLATRVADFVPGAKLTFRPILIFGEADPGARLTIGRDFSRYVTLAASVDLRNAERQTYLMEAHSIPKLPGLVVQVFTNDLEQEGATLQHRLRFGGFRRTAPTGPNLRRLEIDEVPGVKPRALRKAVGLVKGDRASADDLFLAEVEVGEFLRGKGYPDAQVAIDSMPVPERPQKVDIEVEVDPGPRARFEFVGEELSRALQRSITELYRTDFYETQALAEMEAQTVRALRSLGHLNPDVEVSAEVAFDAEGGEERRVTIRMDGGERLDLRELRIAGLPEAESAQAAASFPTQVQRVELAAAEPAADRRLLSAIRSLGYLEPEIVSRDVDDDSRRLTVEVNAGIQSRVAEITVTGVAPERADELGEVVTIEPGEAVRRDRIAAASLALERELQSEGFAKARVRPRVEPIDPVSQEAFTLIFEVEPGIVYQVADAEIKGLRSTSRRWATNVAEMESGAPLREDEVYAARSRLYETGLFTMVGAETIETEGGQADVVFDVEERPRFSVAYGFRWDSDEGTQGVVDAIDQNFLGRSVTLGFRGLYKQDDWSVRLAAGVPRLFGSRATLEIFGTYRDTFEELSDEFFTTEFDQEDLESSLQIAYPFTRSVSGRFYGRYRVSDLRVIEIDQDPIFPLPPTELEFRFKTPLVGTLWIYDSRDRELVLTGGSFASLDLSGTGEFLDSDFEYIRMFSQFNLYRRVGRVAGRRLSWAQSLRLGLADSFDQELDRNDRFFAGGQYSVRGYPTDSLGPVEILGDELIRPLGGKTLVVINQEVRADLLGPVGGIAFFDLGNVWEDTAEFSSSLFKALGVGLRADTPIGLLRLDYAIPLDRREADPSYQLYFGFGNTF